MIEIPFKKSPSFIETLALDSSLYKLYFNWNSSGELWTLSIYDAYKNLLVAGVRLLVNFDFLKQYVVEGLPKGSLLVIDASANTAAIGRYDFENDRALRILYVEENEVL